MAYGGQVSKFIEGFYKQASLMGKSLQEVTTTAGKAIGKGIAAVKPQLPTGMVAKSGLGGYTTRLARESRLAGNTAQKSVSPLAQQAVKGITKRPYIDIK
jgi:hypothetical protein